MAKQEKTPKYIAIDSDILREIAYLDLLKKEYGKNIDPNLIYPADRHLRKDFHYFIALYNSMTHNDIRIVIVDAVYQESKHSECLLNFIKKYCYFPNVNAANYQEKAEKARTLAYAYCSEYEHKGKTEPAPMKSVFVADINKHVPTNDCYIMAQATIEGLPLLTGNGKDFVFNVKNENKEEHDRVVGIVHINILHGYSKTNKKGYEITSAPILIYDLAPMLKQVFKIDTPNQSEDLIKADLLL